jgi:hypothetical protein
MLSPVVSRLFPIQGRPPGHWSRCWLHGTHVRPSIAQLRCRGASCEGGADELVRADSSDSPLTHRTLISASASILVARTSYCSFAWCCMLSSAHSPASGAPSTSSLIAARGRLPFARPFEFLKTASDSRCVVTARTRHSDATWAATQCASVVWSLHLPANCE